jgi:hypothetical protein
VVDLIFTTDRRKSRSRMVSERLSLHCNVSIDPDMLDADVAGNSLSHRRIMQA